MGCVWIWKGGSYVIMLCEAEISCWGTTYLAISCDLAQHLAYLSAASSIGTQPALGGKAGFLFCTKSYVNWYLLGNFVLLYWDMGA